MLCSSHTTKLRCRPNGVLSLERENRFACLELFWRTTSDRDVIQNKDRTGIHIYAPEVGV